MTSESAKQIRPGLVLAYLGGLGICVGGGIAAAFLLPVHSDQDRFFAFLGGLAVGGAFFGIIGFVIGMIGLSRQSRSSTP